jgi:P27 family predicted phage terminase small subunit
MARRGRKPKPTSLKILDGTRSDRVNRQEPSPARVAPPMTAEVEGDSFALEAWNRLVPRLQSLGLLTEADGEALSLYCVTYSRYRLASIDVQAHGLAVETGLGGLKANPAAAVAAECSRLMASLLAEFGLTPASRSRVKAAVEPTRDALADFLARRKS